MKEKQVIDRIYYDIGKQSRNFRVCHTFVDSNNEIRFSKWRSYLEAQENEKYISKCNQREILFDEVVLDLDKSTKSEYTKLINQLVGDGVSYAAFMTPSGRAMHIHTFWRRLPTMSKSIREAIREKILRRYGCDPALKSDSHLIPIEFLPHWKTAEVKKLYRSNMEVYNDFE
jgi:hypothetical protein